jgi:hypothetical protein
MKKVILAILFLLLTEWSYSQIYKTINVTTAGTLSTLITTEELNSVTNLVVTGIINAFDLGIINNMTSLKILDIKDVKIAACLLYDGTPCLEDQIPYGALASNNVISSVTIPSSATSIGYWALYEFSGNINADPNSIYFSSLDGVLYDKSKTILFRCPVTKTGIFTLPSTVTKLGHAAFWDCKYLTNIIFSQALTNIDRYALEDCRALTTIFIPALVSFIGEDAFAGGYEGSKCDISVDPANQYFSSVDGVLFDKNKTKLIKCPTSKAGVYSIPTTVTSIEFDAFHYCQSLSNIYIPPSVTTIGGSAFDMCSKVTGNLVIPSAVTKIEDFAFFGCDFTSVVIPNSITSIGKWAFAGVRHLTTLSIPASVKSLGPAAFSCEKLMSIYVNSATPINIDASTDSVFSYVDTKNCILYVPIGSKPLYSTANQWNAFKNIIEKEEKDFALSTNFINITSEGTRLTVNLTANCSWSLLSNQSWLTVSPTTGSSNETLILTSTDNPTTSLRTAMVSVQPIDAPFQDITVIQAPSDTSLLVSSTTANLPAREGSDVTVSVKSNTSWTVNPDQIWLKVNPQWFIGNSDLKLSATTNTDTIPRKANVIISGQGVSSKIIKVTQASLYTFKPTIKKKWNDVLICNNSDNLLVDYQWYKNDLAINGAIQQFYYEAGGLSGSYCVEVSNINGEKGFSNKMDLSSVKNTKYLNIYPNPIVAFEKLTIEVALKDEELNDSEITIYSIQGLILQKIENLHNIIKLQIDKQGTYILQLHSRSGIIYETTKVIVNH